MTLAVVTGGAGFIGSHLVDDLVASGHRVRVLDDLSTGSTANLAHHDGKIEFVEGSVCDPGLCMAATRDADVVFHLASRVSVVESVAAPGLYRDVVLGGTRRMLEAATTAGVRRFVLASSCSVYGEASPPIGEVARLDPRSPYAAMKAEAEAACRDAAIPTVCPRFFNVYGPRQRADSPYSGVIAVFRRLASASTSPTIFGDGLQTRDFIHVADVSHGLRLAASASALDPGEPINFGTGVGTSIVDLASLLGCPDPVFAAARAGEVRHSIARVDRAEERIGFRPAIDLATGLATFERAD